MNQYETFREIVSECDRNLSAVRWDPERIRKELARRTIREIIQSKEIPLGACVEKEMVIGYFATVQGIKVDLAFMQISKPFYGVKLRAGIEPILDGKDYVFHPSSRGHDFKRGKMPYKKAHLLLSPRITRAAIERNDGKSLLDYMGLDVEDNLFQNWINKVIQINS
ncbi:MAG TPA: hypothetical protein VHA12_03520 [Candidatus Nanoarchaeia archaeon]|nr:hypothetical protein [Candidatus Nanoarchaeia archaeon]